MRAFYFLLVILVLVGTTPIASISAATTTCDSGAYLVTVGSARVRAASTATASQVALVRYNTPVSVIGSAEGTSVNGSTLWCMVSMTGDQVGFIHSSLLTLASDNTSAEPIQGDAAPVQSNAALSPPPSVPSVCAPGVYTIRVNSGTVRTASTTSASQVVRVPYNTAIPVIGGENGTAVSGNTNWCKVAMTGDQIGYIHSSLLVAAPDIPSADPIQVVAAPVQSNTMVSTPIPTTPNSFVCPSNCAGAVAMGLTPQQAATCPHLDRDHDGVACYGD